MKIPRFFAMLGCASIVVVALAGYLHGKEKKKPKNDVCSMSAPSLSTCGSATSPCEVDIKRSGDDLASTTPNIPSAKGNMAFLAKVGTTIKFQSTSKDTGFVLDFGSASPFDSGAAIVGGADRPVSVVAKKPGGYTYSGRFQEILTNLTSIVS